MARRTVKFEAAIEAATTKVLKALDEALAEVGGPKKAGWRDEDLAALIPCIERHAEKVLRREAKEIYPRELFEFGVN